MHYSSAGGVGWSIVLTGTSALDFSDKNYYKRGRLSKANGKKGARGERNIAEEKTKSPDMWLDVKFSLHKSAT